MGFLLFICMGFPKVIFVGDLPGCKAIPQHTTKACYFFLNTNSGKIRAEGKAATINSYRSFASSWSLTGAAERTFYYLNGITQSDKVNKVEGTDIENDEDFIPVNNDKRWLMWTKILNKRS
ncbi:MAG: hypothetical protein WBB06_02745 [Chitinophagaceae bacterium]